MLMLILLQCFMFLACYRHHIT